MKMISVFSLLASVLTIDFKSLLLALFASNADVFANSDETAVVFH